MNPVNTDGQGLDDVEILTVLLGNGDELASQGEIIAAEDTEAGNQAERKALVKAVAITRLLSPDARDRPKTPNRRMPSGVAACSSLTTSRLR